MPTDFRSMRNRTRQEYIDEDRKANQVVFNFTRKNIIESTPPPPAASLGTIADNARLGAQAMSSLDDVINTLVSWSSGVELREAIGAQSFSKARENVINYLNNVQYRVLPSISTTNSTMLTQNLVKDAGEILTKINTVNELIRDYTKVIFPFSPDRARRIQLDPAASAVLAAEQTQFQALKQQLLQLLSLASKSNAVDYGSLPFEKIKLDKEAASEIDRARRRRGEIYSPELSARDLFTDEDSYADDRGSQYQDDQVEDEMNRQIASNESSFYPSDFDDELAGGRRRYGEARYLPRTMFKEDTEFYAPEEESESEPEEEKGTARPQPEVKVVYDGQGIKPKAYKMAGRKIITMPVPVLDAIGGQLMDVKAEEAKVKKAEKEADKDDDGVRFKIGKRRTRR